MPSGPVAVLVNPTAGRGRYRGAHPAVLERLAASGRPVEQIIAANGTQAGKACQAAVDAGATALVALGGDGTAHLPLQAGRRRYDVAILAELLRLRPRTYELGLDGAASTVDAVLVAVANTACYGGGFRICPDADPTDGVLDILVGGRFTRTGIVRIMPHVRRGTHLGHPLVATHRARTVTLAADGITAYADGERVGPLPLTVTSVPEALTLLA